MEVRKLKIMNDVESKIIKLNPLPSYTRNIPTNIEEAMKELDNRIRAASLNSLSTKLNVRIVFKELLEDFQKGMENKNR